MRQRYSMGREKYKGKSTKYKVQSTKEKILQLFSSSVVQLLLASLASSLMMPALQARTVRFRFILGKTQMKTAKPQNCKTAKLQNCKTAKPQNCKTA